MRANLKSNPLLKAEREKRGWKTDLERVVFEGVRDTGLGLVPAAGLDEDGDSGRGLAVVGGGDLHPGGVDDGRKPAGTTGDARRTARGRRSGSEHWD